MGGLGHSVLYCWNIHHTKNAVWERVALRSRWAHAFGAELAKKEQGPLLHHLKAALGIRGINSNVKWPRNGQEMAKKAIYL